MVNFTETGPELDIYIVRHGQSTANADPTLQFDLLTVSGNAIRRLETYSPVVNMDVWDHMVITVPEPCSLVLFSAGTLGLLHSAWRRRKKGALASGRR